MRRISMVLMVVSAGLSGAKRADACSSTGCQGAFVVGIDAGLPVNLGALVIEHGFLNTASNFAVLRPDGGEVALVPVDVVPGAFRASTELVLPSGLEPGSYRVRYGSTCHDEDAGRRAEVSLELGPPAALPTGRPALRLIAEGQEEVARPAGSVCSEVRRTGVARFAIAPPSDWTPFLPVMRWELLVDGTKWSATKHGAVFSDGGVAPLDWALAWHAANEVDSVATCCGSMECRSSIYERVIQGPGGHTAELVAYLPGDAGVLRSEPVEFQLRCEQSGCGCAVARAGESPFVVGFGLLALAVLARRRTGGPSGVERGTNRL